MKNAIPLAWMIGKAAAVSCVLGLLFFLILLLLLDAPWVVEILECVAVAGVALTVGWQLGWRRALAFIICLPALAIRFFPVLLVALLVIPILLAGFQILAPLIFVQWLVWRALK
jgi:hypothetical protein